MSEGLQPLKFRKYDGFDFIIKTGTANIEVFHPGDDRYFYCVGYSVPRDTASPEDLERAVFDHANFGDAENADFESSLHQIKDPTTLEEILYKIDDGTGQPLTLKSLLQIYIGQLLEDEED